MTRNNRIGEPTNSDLDARSRSLRLLVLRSMVASGRGHLGPALSLIEILRVLYDDIAHIDPKAPRNPDRDRIILSKGHGCLALYVVLADLGFFPTDELDGFCGAESILGGHPEFGIIPGVEASTGALGHGLPVGVGMALAAKMQGRNSRVFVVMGDGELNEGTVWEAAMAAHKHRLDNLVAIIDYNKFQSYGPTSEVLEMEPLADKWRSFGFDTIEADGHDLDELREALKQNPAADGRPRAVICHTIKGKGVPDAENNPYWHHKSRLSDAELAAINTALGGGDA